ITCQQCLSPSVVHPVKRSSWSGVLSQKSLNAPNMIMAPQWEYQIQGKRISDQTVLLNCTLMPHITYRNAMPTFHHWRIKDQRFGLSFGSAYDASKFYNRLQKALEHLCHQSKSILTRVLSSILNYHRVVQVSLSTLIIMCLCIGIVLDANEGAAAQAIKAPFPRLYRFGVRPLSNQNIPYCLRNNFLP
ncbi:unnamed protein product, partial [Anisakis simplex]|uniref:SD10629p (inferred by orthology to a D. melanogaster protein) n=1 Tax=Anisakis simplex TaxID=6269 RepID=A0A0M3KGY9_ANISI